MTSTTISTADALREHHVIPFLAGRTEIKQGDRVMIVNGSFGTFIGTTAVIRIVWDRTSESVSSRTLRVAKAITALSARKADEEGKAEAKLAQPATSAANTPNTPKMTHEESIKANMRIAVVCTHGQVRTVKVLAYDLDRREYLVALRRYVGNPDDAMMAVVPMDRDPRWGRSTKRGYLTADKVPAKWVRRIAAIREISEEQVRADFHSICMEANRPRKGCYERRFDSRVNGKWA